LRSGKAKEAIEIFKLNVEVFPQRFNTYDSLAEAYASVNERDLAIQNYKKALELNPTNTNAKDQLERLEKGPVKIDPKVFDTYVGEYEVGPNFVLRVFREGDRFMTQATGQPVFEIFADSETTFHPRAFAAKLTFVKDADGKVTGLLIDQNGRITNGKRIK
jgi:tetratricopeptide (TPR) repeat protein